MADIASCLTACREILSRLPGEAAEGNWEKSSTRWTMHLFGQLREVGILQGFEVRPHQGTQRASGWLYDLVWLRRNADDSLAEAFLVAESEWDPVKAKIIEDFEKLLLARAEVRIMIFNRRKHSQVLDMFSDMDHRIRAFSVMQPGDHYFLAGLAWDSGMFEFHEIRL